MMSKVERVGFRGGLVASTYHPVPHEASPRPQRPSAPQHAPHVGVHTQLFGEVEPQVPSSVMAPVCHAGGVAVVWATTAMARESKSPSRAALGESMMRMRERRGGLAWPGGMDGGMSPLAARRTGDSSEHI